MSTFNYYVNGSGMEMIVPKGAPAPPGYSLIPTASTTNLSPITSIKQANFVDTSNGRVLTIPLGQKIPAQGLKPQTNDPNVIFGYLQGGNILYYDSTQYAPMGTSFFGVYNRNSPPPTNTTTAANQPSSTPQVAQVPGPTVAPPPLAPAAPVAGPATVSPGAIYVNPSGTYIDMPQGAPVPTSWVIATPSPSDNVIQTPTIPPQSQNVSPGAVYQNPAGAYINVPSGTPVPDSWTVATPPSGATVIQAPSTYVAPTVGQTIKSGGSGISTGGTYINPSGTFVNIPAGQPVPGLWRPAVGALAPPAGATIIQAPDTAALVQNAQVIGTIETLIGIFGVAGIAYVGYLIITNPEGAKLMLSKITAFKELAVDISTILVAGTIIFVASLTGYEFWSYYNHYGSVGKALEFMTEDFITNVFTVIVDVLVGAGKALINFWEKSGLGGAVLSGVSIGSDLASGMSWDASVKDSFQVFTGGSSTTNNSDGWSS